MKLAITGGTGLVGRFLVEEALAQGDEVTVLTRSAPAEGFFSRPVAHQPYDLAGPAPELAGLEAVVHAAFDHIPGRYRGGEGDDPERFLARNLDGSRRLFAAARYAGVPVIFLSSRAVYGPQSDAPTEAAICRPDTLYGQAKLDAEAALADQPATILRATGVFGPPGPGQEHKWSGLFADFAAGREIAPRVGSEVSGRDLARAMRLGLSGARGVYNVSDLMLDRRDLLLEWSAVSGQGGKLPAYADPAGAYAMDCGKLRALGWRPSGVEGLRAALSRMV